MFSMSIGNLGEHRDIVKEAFNAMIQASTNLTQKQTELDLSEVDLDWPTLKQAFSKCT